jgi:hypothetical protein
MQITSTLQDVKPVEHSEKKIPYLKEKLELETSRKDTNITDIYSYINVRRVTNLQLSIG